jgi:hypothetical protein
MKAFLVPVVLAVCGALAGGLIGKVAARCGGG